ncbi:MAG: chromosomal replication initiator protein DnaA [Myxococcales bacterium]|nr:chromosomal replication initiator protein DnaA [Myxococcales bacterium]
MKSRQLASSAPFMDEKLPRPLTSFNSQGIDSVNTWSNLKAALRDRVSSQVYAAWIAQIRASESSQGELVLALPDRFAVDWVRDHYRDVIAECLREIDPKLSFKVVLDPDPQPKPPETGLETRPKVQPEVPSSQPARVEPTPSAPPDAEFSINEKYTFDAFVVGDSNKLAAAAAKSVAENPGSAYNPLFVFGRVGLGKTHLIQAIANTVRRRNPHSVVRYQTTEKFVNDVVQGIRFERMNDLRATYRHCDVLLIDDIQFIAGKEACQAEFFHTFNALHQSGKQVVVTSDKLPHEIPDLEERVRSRFIWGLIVDLQPPELETRMAIVKKKADVDGIELPDEVAMFIAQSVRSNVRELEGCLIRVSAYAQLSGRQLTIELARSVLRDVLPGKGQLTLDAIMKTTCKFFDVRVSDLKGSKRARAIAQPRQVAMYLCRKHAGASYPEIGKAFGGKDHTTALNAYNRIRDRIEQEHELKRQVELIENNLVE